MRLKTSATSEPFVDAFSGPDRDILEAAAVRRRQNFAAAHPMDHESRMQTCTDSSLLLDDGLSSGNRAAKLGVRRDWAAIGQDDAGD